MVEPQELDDVTLAAQMRALRAAALNTPDGLDRVEAAAGLLPAPGAEVVRAAVAEIRRLRLREVSRVQPPPVAVADAAEIEWAVALIRKLCDVDDDARRAAWMVLDRALPPIHMLLCCPVCHVRHVDRGEFATRPHRKHACQSCGNVWQPALVATVGVQFLPGYKDRPDGHERILAHDAGAGENRYFGTTPGRCAFVVRMEKSEGGGTRALLCGEPSWGGGDFERCPAHGGPAGPCPVHG